MYISPQRTVKEYRKRNCIVNWKKLMTVPQDDIKMIIRDLNAKTGREEIFTDTTGKQFTFHL